MPFLFSSFALFLYAKSYVLQIVSKKEIIFHSIPMTLAFALFIINVLSEQVGVLPKVFSSNPIDNNIFLNLAGGLHFVAYLALTVSTLRRFKDNAPTITSKLSWLQFLTSTSLIVCLAVLSLVVLNILLKENFDIRWAYLVWTTMSILIYGIGYAALQKPEVFQPVGEVLSNISSSIIKYRNTKVSTDLAAEVVGRIESLMKEDKLYKQSDLNLKKLATYLKVSPNVLSRIINEHYDLNYNQLLNEYRLDEVRQKISDPAFDKYTILGIALEAGFNSKSSFNEFFKKRLNQSPNEFKKNSRIAR
ncbi:MAG: helix-turn-helix domain-containing protein [Cyclobacteriaceae bacterium]